MKRCFFACLLTVLVMALWAEGPKDVTSLIVNPSFENGLKGWKTSNLQTQTNSVFTMKAGGTYVEKWVSKGSQVGDARASQVLKALPLGKYRLTAGVQNLNENATTQKCSGAYLYAGSQRTLVQTPADYSVEFAHVYGDVEIGFEATGATGNWLALDNFRLTLVGEVSKSEALPLLTEAVVSAKTLLGDGTGHDAEVLKAAIADVESGASTATQATEIVTLYETLSQAVAAYRLANVSELLPLDRTEYIVNADFENGLTSWVTNGLKTQTNTTFTKKSGATYVEKWVDRGTHVGDATAEQVLTELPVGVYKLVASAQNLNQNATSQQCEGAYIYADLEQAAVTTPADYSVKFTNVTGKVRIGFTANAATGNWLALDNFRLYLIGTIDKAGILAQVQQLISEGEQLEIPAEIASTYTVSATLTDALAAARKLGESSTETEIATTVETLKAAIAQERVLIERALFVYHINNPGEGSGVAVRVTETNPFVATGATEALMRAAVVGANIMEKGVCWSTAKNPTVLDNRSTKRFSLKGDIFHLQGLQPSTVYYLRPYVMNKSYQVAYGDQVKIVTHPKGSCTWSWDEGSPDAAANERCRTAMRQTIDYFNEWTGIMGFHLSGHYGAGTPTADCSYGGWMRIGPNAGNQAIGTVLHETGHGVGVGTHWRWNGCTDTRESEGKYGYWLGREANRTLRFLENCDNEAVMLTGDAVHGWGTIRPNSGSVPNASISFDWFVNGADKDKHDELQYIGGMCLLHGLFIDGLCPTSGYANGISGYTFNFDDEKKYYLMSKDAEHGLGTNVLYQRNANGILAWNKTLTRQELSDSAAWYLEYDPQQCYYHIRNAATGRYLTHTSKGVVMAKKLTDKPMSSEGFQLMPDRTDVTLGDGTSRFKTHGYWFCWDYDGVKAMAAGMVNIITKYGDVKGEDFNFSNEATTQQWVIIDEDELHILQALLPTGISEMPVAGTTPDASSRDGVVYDLQGRRVANPGHGLYIVGGKKMVK